MASLVNITNKNNIKANKKCVTTLRSTCNQVKQHQSLSKNVIHNISLFQKIVTDILFKSTANVFQNYKCIRHAALISFLSSSSLLLLIPINASVNPVKILVSFFQNLSQFLFYWYLFVFFCLIFKTGQTVASDNTISHSSYQLKDDDYQVVCSSVDIRYDIEEFRVLNGCNVVEGFVKVLLMDQVNRSAMARLSFPNLTEITEYLLLFRVAGITTLSKLFPNLVVIRGRQLFFEYALIIYEMPSLYEIGLHTLTDIEHGLIRIDQNPLLCYLDTIDWDRIAHQSGKHYIKMLRPPSHCGICPGITIGTNPMTCPIGKPQPMATLIPMLSVPSASPNTINATNDTSTYQTEQNSTRIITTTTTTTTTQSSQTMFNYQMPPPFEFPRYLCWNHEHCQKICPEHCISCNANGDCCSDTCLGGCELHDSNKCRICRSITTYDSEGNRKCLSHCPPNLYRYLDRRCITAEQCFNMKRPSTLQSIILEDYPFKIYGDSCILNCPINYMGDDYNHCVPCAGKCRKRCRGLTIDSTAKLKQLRRCTHITGSLELQISGGYDITDLEENLGMIEEIYGYLKVIRSYPLVSFNFFKSLRRIRGEELENDRYVISVVDNQNLQDLWNLRNTSLTVDKGYLFVHFNPKLCMDKIRELQYSTHLDNFTEMDVSYISNGDKVVCDLLNLKIIIKTVTSRNAIIEWDRFMVADQRKLLGYLMYVIEAPHRNVTLFDGRDACGSDGWRVQDVSSPHENTTRLYYLLTLLKPFTQYAVYVKTYTVDSEQRGAQSPIEYLVTTPGTPTQPRNVQILRNNSDALWITWEPPQHPNGNLSYYLLTGKRHKNGFHSYIPGRDYCAHPPPKQSTTYTYKSAVKWRSNSSSLCKCGDGNPDLDEIAEATRINFENELQNEVYIKRFTPLDFQIGFDTPYPIRKKRNIKFPDNLGPPDVLDTNIKVDTDRTYFKNVSNPKTGTWDTFSFKLRDMNEFRVTNLHHFTYYYIYVQACREKLEEKELESDCSPNVMRTERTAFKKNTDSITDLKIVNETNGVVYLTWMEPSDPNGIVYSYSVEYKQVNIENGKAVSECLIYAQFLKNNRIHKLGEFLPGNYSVHVRTTTSAGDSEYSDYIYVYVKSNSNEIPPNPLSLILVVTFTSLSLLSVSGFGVWYRRRRLHKNRLKLITSVNPEYVSSVYVSDEWEMPRSNIEILSELGQGSFGMVYEGIVSNLHEKTAVKCAVKTVNKHATSRERAEFLHEATVMKAFDTTHVVRLLGVVSKGQPTLVVMELMAYGDLKSYLRSYRVDSVKYNHHHTQSPLTLHQIVQMVSEIADGMAYLAGKKFVHRDLAARNCMVAGDLTVKIGDFGMTRDIYETDYYRKGSRGLLPVRWMSPESLKDGVFTTQSDVWSFGVIVWEMSTFALQPYQGLSNDQVLRYVIDGGVMERPDRCPDKLYQLMRYCWHHDAMLRPRFIQICTLLSEDVSTTFVQNSFYHSQAGIEARQTRNGLPSDQQNIQPLRIMATHQEEPKSPLWVAAERQTATTTSAENNSCGDYADNNIMVHSSYLDGNINYNTVTTSRNNGFRPSDDYPRLSTHNLTPLPNGYLSGGPSNSNVNTIQF